MPSRYPPFVQPSMSEGNDQRDMTIRGTDDLRDGLNER